MRLVLRNGDVLCGGTLQAGTDLHVEGETVAQIGRNLSVTGGDEIDLRGCVVAPGYVDLHLHGVGGANCESGDVAAIREISRQLPAHGVTSFLPTIAALPAPQLRSAVLAIRSVRGNEPGARILGIHLEGPYLNPAAAGAQDRSALRLPSISELDELQGVAAGGIRLITIAPELAGALEFIAAARQRGITISIGHTLADAETTRLAIAAGARHVTHLFNAMSPMHHRDPGPIGVVLTTDEMSVEIIADGHHVAPEAIRVARRCKPPGKFVVVSDAVAMGLEDGIYQMFGTTCLVRGGAIRQQTTGVLTGSVLGLDDAVRNLRAWFPMDSIATHLAAVSSNPAAVIGEGTAGSLEIGATADLVALDAQWRPKISLCRGEVRFSAL